ncbi:hypothetical protein GALL_522150 [mine drainage metagenome]|uniref:Uncharacterized protein n=1 Tax=mine drainage metagenome TaxID=410659 RepID=A0A1J5PLP6_9ZZZZ
MPPDVAQEIEVVQVVKPFRVVEDDRICRALAKLDVGGEHLLDPGDVRVDLLGAEQRALIRAERGVAHLGGAAAHQHDRLAAALLQPAQHHDLDQAANMQRFRRGIKADIGRDHAFDESLVQRLIIGAAGHEAALHHHAHEV